MARCHATDDETEEQSFDRRSYLKMAGTAAMAAAVPLTSATKTTAQSTSYANGIGGGDGYGNTVSQSDADETVASSGELHDALAGASSGDVVYVTSGFDVGSESFSVPADVTLAGGRGNGSDGPLLQTGNEEPGGVIDAEGGSRVTGLRLDGPIHEYTERDVSGTGIEITGSDAEVDNCEISGFPYAGVEAGSDCHVHHNDIHHCSRDGLGYGVVVGANPLIEYNYFNYNRHSIACGGSEGSGYEARYNVFGPDMIGYNVGVHQPGGERFEVHHNTFEGIEAIDGTPDYNVVCRGAPADVMDIHHNWFRQGEKPDTSERTLYSGGVAIMQYKPERENFESVTFSDNQYGTDEPASGTGAPRSGSGNASGGDSGDDGNGGSSGSDFSNVVSIQSDEKVHYQLSVSGDIEKSTAQNATIDPEDTIDGSSVSGRVWGGRDSYAFSGDLADFEKDGPAEVTVNGKPIAASD